MTERTTVELTGEGTRVLVLTALGHTAYDPDERDDSRLSLAIIME